MVWIRALMDLTSVVGPRRPQRSVRRSVSAFPPKAALGLSVKYCGTEACILLLLVAAKAPAKKAAKLSKPDASGGPSDGVLGSTPGEPGGEDAAQLFSASGRHKRKDAGTDRVKPIRWSDEEEEKFVEGLGLHGREWAKVAAVIGTREAKAVTSHAQKYFIKLLLAGKPLPAKVAESGTGYTLSGKPLDLRSATARANGIKPEIADSEPSFPLFSPKQYL